LKASDIVSSSPVSVTAAGARKSGHFKVVGKHGKDDSDASDALSSLFSSKAKVAAKGQAKADAKVDAKVKMKADDMPQAQFSALLDQVEKKLKTGSAKADDDDTSDEDTEQEDDASGEADAPAIKSQNGTTSLFAGAFMMRSFEPALLKAADTSAKAEEAETKPIAVNSNKIEVTAKAVDVKATPQLKLVDATQPQQEQPKPMKAEAKPIAPTETATPEIQISDDVKAEAKIQVPSQTKAEVKADSQVIADAQAQGVVSEIHVTMQHESDGGTSRDSDRGKDEPQKDKTADAKAKTEAATPQGAVKAEAAAVVASTAQAADPSPVRQVVERILQELPASTAVASTDAVAQASKVMTVRLHPEGLGTVMVRISNSGGSMKISLSSDQQGTSEQLESDSSQLLQALQQVMPSFSADNLSFSTNDQNAQDPQNTTNQNAANGNSNSGQWNEGQSYAEQGGRQVPNPRSSGRFGPNSAEAPSRADTGSNTRAGGSVYL